MGSNTLCYLLDLERTVTSGLAHYWKANRRGYTRDILEAGLFDEPVAARLVAEDFDKRTVLIPAAMVEKLLGIDEDFKKGLEECMEQYGETFRNLKDR